MKRYLEYVLRRREMRADRAKLRLLKRCLKLAALMEDEGNEALRRLQGDAGHIEASLRRAQEGYAPYLPAENGRARVLHIAAQLLDGGAHRMDGEGLLQAIQEIDAVQGLEMEEMQFIPDALNMALCEALAELSGEIIRGAQMRSAAETWVRRGGRGALPRGGRAFFLEHALQLAAEMEQPLLHARAERAAQSAGGRTELLVEHAHRMAADHCLRLDNLMAARRLLDALDWEKCFKQISTADIELHEDPSGVYGAMDDASRAEVRMAAAELAKFAGMNEIVLVRHALRLARENAGSSGAHDLRSTVCWYLAGDEGRAELCRSLGLRSRPRRRIPDARGGKTVSLAASVTALLLLVLVWGFGEPLLAVYALPLAWVCAQRVIGRLYSQWVKPARLLRLELEAVPESARTLVVLPVLLSSVERVQQMIGHMQALGCMEGDPNIDFLLLGDFRDADDAHQPEDDAILSAGREGIACLNREAEREKYFYLHRERSWREKDGRWMGENRKRGALMALNRLLLNRIGAREAFRAEGSAATRLAGHYRYVVTLDADTRYLPGTIAQLAGVMLHPLNRACAPEGRRRGYAVLQPCMQLAADANVNRFVSVVAGSGGMDSYPVSVSDFYQDMTGRGCFAGKGIYDVQAFASSTEGVLRDEDILSHDLIEGILSGAGFVNDVHFYEGCPENLEAELIRRHRWTRGDWQLLPVLFSHLPIAAVDRMKLLGNLLQSLFAPALAGLLIHSAWLDVPIAFSIGLILAFQEPLMRPLRGGRRMWKHALLKLAILPTEAACALDAIGRTLWRLAVSRKHMMDWVPAADASGRGRRSRRACRIAAILMLPGLLHPFWIPAVLALAALFFVGADWADDLAQDHTMPAGQLDGKQKKLLLEIAERTWHFFEYCVPEDGCGLPPDNIQLDPPAGAAQRTSPTNIGLYLMSCLAARELGFLCPDEMLRRMRATAGTLERMEKWNGQLYNWYDIRDMRPLQPRYVSSVDSGNLAAALLLCAQATGEADAALSARLLALAENMDLAALYDEERRLFRIGVDVENGVLSQSHYDLYASEARILSYTAMMLGQVPLRHWKHLSRAAVRTCGHQALVSWSGTMFEYLMPELLLPSWPDTLAGQGVRGALACQMAHGNALDRPWGVSESGYYAFDLQLNYQYRAFGMRALSLSGNARQDVAAPYAAALALALEPAAAADNLRRMCSMGWSGEYGMYEAADYLHEGQKPRIVRSHMAHHQGMVICAICNALKDGALGRRFMEIPRARALELLLQEKPGAKIRLQLGRKHVQMEKTVETARRYYVRSGRAADVHLLCGGGTTALLTTGGAVFAWRDELQLNRFSGDVQSAHEGMYVHLRDVQDDRCAVVGGKVQFDAGSACFRKTFEELEVQMHVFVSPEDGTLYQRIEIENPGKEERYLEVTGCMAVALAKRQDMRAHPAFQNLFVESSFRDDCALVFRRRRRKADDTPEELIYLASGEGEVDWESSMDRLTGRSGSLGEPDGIARRFTRTSGFVLNPCAALRLGMRIPGEGTVRMHFAAAVAGADNVARRIQSMRMPASAERALQLSGAHALAVLAHAGVDAGRFRLFERAAAMVLDAKLRLHSPGSACGAVSREALWRAGISGDIPILLVETGEDCRMDCVRDCIRMHAFYRAMGLKADLVLLDGRGGDYRRTQQERMADMLASGHLNGASGTSGGFHFLEMQNQGADTVEALRRFAALRFDGCGDFAAQLRGMLDAINVRGGSAYAPMQDSEPDFPEELAFFNEYGGFENGGYTICLRDGVTPPAPWSNVIASENGGAIVTERCGGFAWFGNSRSDRLTAFANDVLREGWGWMFYLMDEGEREWMRLLPGDLPMAAFRVHHAPELSRWSAAAGGIAFSVEMHAHEQGVQFDIALKNEGEGTRHLRLAGFVDWLMGTDSADALRTWSRFGACFAAGEAQGVGCFASDDPRARTGCDRRSFLGGGDIMQPRGLDALDRPSGGWTLHVPLSLKPGEARCCRFLLAGARDKTAAYELARKFRSGEALRRSGDDWNERLKRLEIHTPDAAVNLLANGFLQAQALNARIRGRTGLYQPGGAYGFRDQLQDMLPMIHYEPARVRRHLLYCAARQFEKGDVLHWWHDPYSGVRTRISDDLLFLPYVAAQYVRITGDEGILQDHAPFLQDVPIPEGRHDIYAQMQPSDACASLHEHCMRAFRHAACTGEHGLCLMGSGDWNDGMDRVGAGGRGESIWLSEFLAACAVDYARILPAGEDKTWLEELAGRMRAAIEKHGWDGQWYLRAYADDGRKLGGRECDVCRIDAISQAWAVMAGLNKERTASAMESAWKYLADEKLQLIRLLDPPFEGADFDPGYIAAYPPGVRENGAQYTHAACWVMIALALQGDADRAHRALRMLIPANHSRTKLEADIYRVEPYAMAADVYTRGEYAGRGGWTWYTGSAAWMLMGILAILGFERRKNHVRLHALLGDWQEASVSMRCGRSCYTLTCRRDVSAAELDGERMEDGWIELIDDGRDHIALFPPRQ